jgi:hypothetical protein
MNSHFGGRVLSPVLRVWRHCARVQKSPPRADNTPAEVNSVPSRQHAPTSPWQILQSNDESATRSRKSRRSDGRSQHAGRCLPAYDRARRDPTRRRVRDNEPSCVCAWRDAMWTRVHRNSGRECTDERERYHHRCSHRQTGGAERRTDSHQNPFRHGLTGRDSAAISSRMLRPFGHLDVTCTS